MAKTPKSDSSDIIDAVDETAPPETNTQQSAKAAPVKEEMDDIDDRNPFMAFVYDHPWISFFIFYLALTALVRVWGWATIAFLAIPLVCFVRIWLLSRKTDVALEHEDHLKVAWWAKVGMMSSFFGLTSALILSWLGVLHIFN